MVREDLLMHKTRDLLNEFRAPMLQEVDKPRRRFLQHGTHLILRDFVEHLCQRGSYEVQEQRVVFSQVFLPDHPRLPG